MRLSLYALLFVLLTGCGLYRSASIRRDIYRAKLVNAPVNDTLHVENKMGLMMVYVKVNNHPRPLEFIFDTGANLTVLNSNTAKELGLSSDRTMKLGDSQGSSYEVSVINLDTLQLGNGVYTDVLAAIIPFPENSMISCMARDGILGYHVIRNAQWAYHPGDTILVGSISDLRGNRTYENVEMTGRKAPVLSLDYNGVRYGGVLFDSGSTGGLDLKKSAMNPHMNSKRFVTQIDGTTQGVYGNVLDTVYRVYNDTVQVAGIPLLSNVDFSDKVERKIGMSAFGNRHFIIDGQNERLYLGEAESDAVLSRSYGFVPGLRDSTLYVANLNLQSQAHQDGAEMEKIIYSINGRTAKDLLNTDCGYLKMILFFSRNEENLTIEYRDGSVFTYQKHVPSGELLNEN
ncbi:MAG: hypothetical protein EP346_04625 [Bacteroidetes bacterium]|nr:MAG: hypothetical protein EP346_04625 [Bacteroidota bacterium]